MSRGSLRLIAFGAVAASVLALPAEAVVERGDESYIAAAAAPQPVRAAPLARRDAVTQPRAPSTTPGDAPPQPKTYEVQEGDTLLSIAAHYGVTVETIAFNNDITDPTALKIGTVLRIPPMDAVIYIAKEGDTVEGLASRFGADLRAVMDLNRLYFEPQNFGPGKTVLVPMPGGQYPGFALKETAPTRPPLSARPVAALPPPQPPSGRRLGWPLGGIITQYFWYGHLGVDIAAPFGSGIAAADEGVVSAEGWVPVGGLRICVRHDGGMETCYYHTSATYVDVGQRVKRSQIIAAVGLTGVTTGPHVHWEARLNGRLVNPLAY